MPALPRPSVPRRRLAQFGGSAAVLLPLALVAACGGEDNEPISAGAAQERLVAVADRLDACYAKTSDTRKCTSSDALGDTGDATLGRGTGQVQITASRPTRYGLTLDVDARVRFSIVAQPVGARQRTCTPANTAGCDASGVW